MNKIEALIQLGLITVDDVWNYVSEKHYEAMQEEITISGESYTEADFQIDSAHNESF